MSYNHEYSRCQANSKSIQRIRIFRESICKSALSVRAKARLSYRPISNTRSKRTRKRPQPAALNRFLRMLHTRRKRSTRFSRPRQSPTELRTSPRPLRDLVALLTSISDAIEPSRQVEIVLEVIAGWRVVGVIDE